MGLLSRIRNLIGKNTKFRFSQCFIRKKPSRCGKTKQPIFFLSFLCATAMLLPVGDNTIILSAYKADASAELFGQPSNAYSDPITQTWLKRFAGEVAASPEIPVVGNDAEGGLNAAKSKSIRMLRNFIRAQIRKYEKSATDMPFLHVDEDNTPKFPSNQTSKADNGTQLERRKRGVIYADATLSMARSQRQISDFDSEGPFIIRNVDRFTPQYYDSTNAIDINCQKVQEKSLVFSIEESENKQRKLMIHQLNERDMKQRLLMSTTANDAVSVEVIKIKDDLFAFTTVKHAPQETPNTLTTGSTLYKINLATNTIDKTQTIHMPFAKSSVFWNGVGEEANDMFLALAPTRALTESGTTTFNVMVPCYRWQGGYFDYVSEFQATNPQAIEHFNMLSHDYLAVANYQDDTGSVSIESEIFKYHYSDRRFVSFQKIMTHGATDMKHFTFETDDGSRREHFIAIANSCKKDEEGKLQFMVQSTIMKFVEERFQPFKTFYTFGAQQFLPVNHDGRFFLAVADLRGIRMLQFNGWTFVETHNIKYDTVQSTPFSLKLRQLNHKGASFMTVASKTAGIQNGMFAVDFETRNDQRKLITSVEQWCIGANKLMDDKNLMDIEKELNEAPKITDERVEVNGRITFEKGVQVDHLRSRALRMGRARNLGHHEMTTLAGLEKKYSRLTSRVGTLKSQKDNVVMVDQNEEISGPVFIQNMVYDNPSLQIRDLQVEKFGSVKVSDHLDNLVFLNKPQSLKRLSTGKVDSTDLSTKSINGHPMSDYALRNPTAKQVFTGNNEFTSGMLVKNSVKVKERFADLSFSRPNFILGHGNQTFPGVTMTLTGTEVKNLHTRTVNGHDVFFMYREAMPLTGGTITAEKRFQSMEIRNLEVESLNNVNINGLYENAIYTDGRFPSQTFQTPKYFESMAIGELNPLNRNINEEFDPSSSFINTETGEYKLKNLKIMGETQIDDLFVGKQLNNIKVEEGRMDVLFKNSEEPQLVKSKSLKSLKFNEHVEAPHRVDGIELESWSQVQDVILENNVIEGILNLQGNIDTRENDVSVGKAFHLGQTDVLNILRKSATLDSTTLPGNCAMEFQSLKVEGSSEIKGLINNEMKPSQWVVNSEHKEIAITGEKIFTGPVHLEKDTNAQALFGDESKKENLLEVVPTLLLDGSDQTIKQKMTFTKSFRADEASCPNAMLDGVEFGDVLYKTGDHTVEVESIFRKPVIATGGTSVMENVAVHFVNGINLSNELKDTLRTVGNQVVTAPYTFTEVKAQETKVVGTFAHSDINSIFDNIVLKNQRVELTNTDLIFNEAAELDRLSFVGHVNGIPTSQWGNAWVLTRTDQEILTKIEFEGPVTVNNFFAPTVNNFDIKMLDDIVRVDRDEILDGTLEFNNPVTVESGVIMPDEARVNGMDLRRDVLLKSHESVQTISGSNSFMKGMTVNGHLTVSEMKNFDFHNFATLIKSSSEVKARSERDPVSLVINGNAKLEHEPQFTSRINGHSWQSILENTWFRDQDVVLQHPVKFSSLILENGGTMEDAATLNGLNLKEFQENYASKTRDNVWKGQMTFKNVEKINRMEAKSLVLESGGQFNGEDVQEFYHSSLRYTGDQIIQGQMTTPNLKTRRLDVESGANLNSLEMQDFMTVTGPNELRSTKRFGNIVARKIVLSPNTVIDGVNMGNWNENAVRKDGNFDIKGPVQFSSLRTTENIIVEGLVDGIQYDTNNVLTADQDQEIFGPVTIIQPEDISEAPALKLPAGVLIEGTLNGVNVKESMSKMVFRDVEDESPIVINSEMAFNAPVSMSKVTTKALLQGQDVSVAMGSFKRANERISSATFSAREGYEALVNIAAKMMKTTENKAVFLHYYVPTQTIKTRSTYVKPLTEDGYPVIAIGFKKSEFVTTENWWAYNAHLDYYQLQVGNRAQMEGTVVDIAKLPHEKGSFFAVAVNSEDSSHIADSKLEVLNTINNFEMDKSSDKRSKTFILKTVDAGTPNMRPAISQVIHGHEFKSIRSFSVARSQGSSSCMVATTSAISALEDTTSVYCLDKDNGVLNKVQEFNFDSPTLTTTATISKMTMLFILTRSSVGQPEGLLEMWGSREQENALHFGKEDCLPAFNVVSMDALSTNDGKTFLAIASGALRGSDYQGSVFIYKYSVQLQKFKKIQTIETVHPLDVKLQWLQLSNEVLAYVLSDSVTNNVQVFKYKGLSGWEPVHKFTSENGKSIQVTDFHVDGYYRAQLLVTSLTETKIYAAEFIGGSEVLEERTETQSIFQTNLAQGLIDDK